MGKKNTEKGVLEAEGCFWSWADRGRSYKDWEFQCIKRANFFKPWLIRPVGRRSTLETQDLEEIQFPQGKWLLLSFHPWGTRLSSPSWTDRSEAGIEQLKALDSFHTEPLAHGSMTTNTTAAFSEARGKGKWERDFRDCVAGPPSGIELETGGSGKSRVQVEQFPQRPHTEELVWNVSQLTRSKEKLPRSEAKGFSLINQN